MERSITTYEVQTKIRNFKINSGDIRSQQYENGLLEGASSLQDMTNVLSSDSEEDLEILEINSNDSLDNESWLFSLPGCPSIGESNVQQWVRQDVDNNNDYKLHTFFNQKAVYAAKEPFSHRVDDCQQSSKRHIDTRTFTRPKRRSCRPSLEPMTESPYFEAQNHIPSIWDMASSNSKYKVETLDDINITLYSSVSISDSFCDTSNIDEYDGNSLCEAIESDPRLKVPSQRTSDYSSDDKLSKTGCDLSCGGKSASKIANGTFLKSDSGLNSTFSKVSDMNATFHISGKSQSTPSVMNCTYVHIPDGSNSGSSNRSLRTPSVDSCVDDDQLSSASDSSMSSSNRLMNMGDVQNIARLQEESLKRSSSSNSSREGSKLITSTPCNTYVKGAFISGSNEEVPLPISRSGSYQEVNHGYFSDHSDHSSIDGAARSSISSVKSSPRSSPFGSTHDNIQLHTELKVPVYQRQDVQFKRPELTVDNGRRVTNLQQPTTRGRGTVRGGTSGLPRPVAPVRTGIPRLATRLPAPRARPVSAVPASKLYRRGASTGSNF